MSRPQDAVELDQLLSQLDSEAQNWIKNEYAKCGLKYDILREIKGVIAQTREAEIPVTPRSKIIAKGLKQSVTYAQSKGVDCNPLMQTCRSSQFTKWALAMAL